MGLVSAFAIIRALSLFHLTLAFFFLTSPSTIAEQNIVFVLGEAMRLPSPTSFSTPTPATGFLAVVLALLGLSDFTAVSLPDEIARIYWAAQVPVRLLFLFVVTGYTYAFKPDGMLAKAGVGYKAGMGEGLKNRLVFTWGFLEVAAWFWVFISLRDERRQAGIRLIEKRKAEEDRL
ncbi:hypothetical protein LTR04_005834 [Oleoguttula sp. CCFEE 6159]|nr:hypothetical protein LTR04_005834 [Oleoguttula sp. CCFEE 6159]